MNRGFDSPDTEYGVIPKNSCDTGKVYLTFRWGQIPAKIQTPIPPNYNDNVPIRRRLFSIAGLGSIRPRKTNQPGKTGMYSPRRRSMRKQNPVSFTAATAIRASRKVDVEVCAEPLWFWHSPARSPWNEASDRAQPPGGFCGF